MEMSTILSPSGEPVFTAGGNHAWKVAEHRGFVASLEWARRRRTTLAMLVIWPAGNILTVGAPSPGMWAISRNVISQFVGHFKRWLAWFAGIVGQDIQVRCQVRGQIC